MGLPRFFLIAGVWFGLALVSFGDETEKGAHNRIWIAELRGTINPGSADFLKESIRRAEQAKAEALLIELDTPGGLVMSVREMAQAIDSSKVPVIVFITPAGAAGTSAGALLMLAAHVGAMSPGTNVGSAHPVGPKGEEAKGAMGEKVVNDVAAFARGLAELRGRDPELAESLVRKSKNLTAKEAMEKKLIDYIADDRAALLKMLHGREVKLHSGSKTLNTQNTLVTRTEMTFAQKLLDLLANPNIAAILMTLGMLLLYVELTNPGITIAGVLGGICLLIAFMAFQVLPIQTGGVALIILGVVLIAAEVFVGAGGALAAGGSLSFLLGLLWVIDPSKSDMTISLAIWIPLAVTMLGGVIIVAYATARMRKLAGATLTKIGGGSLSGLSGYEGKVESIKKNGKRGKVAIRGELWNFVSDEPVKPGDVVRAKSVKGFVVKI